MGMAEEVVGSISIIPVAAALDATEDIITLHVAVSIEVAVYNNDLASCS